MSEQNNVQIKAITIKLVQLQALIGDLSPVMREIAETLKMDVDEAFEFKRNSSTHQKWQSLDQKYQQQRLRQGKWGNDQDILRVEGELYSSIKTDYGKKFAEIGTDNEYAAIHQFGGKTKPHKIKNAFGVEGLTVEHPGSIIPARGYLPFDGLHPDTEAAILDLLDDKLADCLS